MEAGQPFKTLWILEYFNGQYYSLKAFYGVSEEDVERQVDEWVEHQLPVRIVRMGLRHFPGGFKWGRSELPGKVPIRGDNSGT